MNTEKLLQTPPDIAGPPRPKEGARRGKAPPAGGRAEAQGSRLGSLLKFLGPAFIVSVAYIDPG